MSFGAACLILDVVRARLRASLPCCHRRLRLHLRERRSCLLFVAPIALARLLGPRHGCHLPWRVCLRALVGPARPSSRLHRRSLVVRRQSCWRKGIGPARRGCERRRHG
jgi:hypothetical protein